MSRSGALANGSPADKYKQAFQEEAREILVDLESTLLELNEHPEDSELVGQGLPGAAHHQGIGRDVRLRGGGCLHPQPGERL